MDLLRMVVLLSCLVVLVYGAVPPRQKSNTPKSVPKILTKGRICKQRFSGFRSHYVKINEECKKGVIRWTLTKKYLSLSFQVSRTKELCFSSRAPNGLQKYTVFKRSGKKMKKIGTPMRGFDVCTVIKKGVTNFRIDPTGLYYGLYVRYTLIAK